jgi:hypothetical protein
MLATEWRPPRIHGEVPLGYDGPVYYRSIRLFGGKSGKKDISQHISFQNCKIGGQNVEQRWAAYVALDPMRLDHPDMFEASGALKTEWCEPLIAKRKASFPQGSDRLESFGHCSQWVRNAIEAVEPGVHAFLPVRLTGGGSEDDVIYRWVCGNGGRGFVGLSERSNPSQNWVSGGNHLLQTTDFAYLSVRKIEGRHILWCELGHVWSKELIDRIGDVFSDQIGLIPMGVSD